MFSHFLSRACEKIPIYELNFLAIFLHYITYDFFLQCIRSSGNSTKRSQSQEEKHLNRRLLDCLSRLRLVSGLHLKKSDCRMPHLPDILTPAHLNPPLHPAGFLLFTSWTWVETYEIRIHVLAFYLCAYLSSNATTKDGAQKLFTGV